MLVVILAALVLFARTVNWTVAWRAIRATSPGLLAAAAIVNLLSIALKGVRWWIFLRPVGVPSLWLAMRATFAGAALNNILVANSGEAARVIFVARATHVSSEKVLATVALERLFEIVGYVVLLTLAVSFLALPPNLDDFRPVSMIALVAIVALLLYLIRHPEDAELPAVAGEGLLHRVKHYGRGFLRTLTAISTPGRFGAALALSVFVWALQVATYHLTARAAHFEISVVGTIAALLAVNLGFLVRATPGNVGVFQMMYAVTATGFGLDKDAATGVALLIQIQQVVPVMVLGLLAAPKMLFERRRDTMRRDNVLPGEPAPPKITEVEG
ncbi:MAG: lysylphosphatidylglycerol synthase transmembrane domain-containing protein [Gemmatimonadaceae bacterium]